MKKLIISLIFLLILCLTYSAFGFDLKKKWAIHTNSGLIIPFGKQHLEGIDLSSYTKNDTDDFVNISMSFGVNILYRYTENYMIELNLNYAPFTGNVVTEEGGQGVYHTEWEDKTEFDLHLLETTIGIRGLFPEGKWGILYFAGGIGSHVILGKVIESFSYFSNDIETVFDTTSQNTHSIDNFGIYGGGGLMHFFKNNTALDIQGKIHVASTITYLSISGGITFFF